MVDNQIEEVKENGSDVKVSPSLDFLIGTDRRGKAILLVGGFGTNRYMHKKLSEAHKTGGIKVLQVNNG